MIISVSLFFSLLRLAIKIHTYHWNLEADSSVIHFYAAAPNLTYLLQFIHFEPSFFKDHSRKENKVTCSTNYFGGFD